MNIGTAQTGAATLEIDASPPRTADALQQVWHARRLLSFLLRRDMKGRYRGTFLGNWWLVVRPLVELAPYMVVFGIFLDLRPGPIPYVLYLLSGFAPWLLFRGCVSTAPNVLAKARSLITKVYFPRLVLPLKELGLYASDFAVILLGVVLLGLAFGFWPARTIVGLPLFVTLLVVLSLGASIVLAALCAIRPDLGFGVPALTRVLFYLSPIAYPLSLVPERIRPWYELNPITTVISGLRWSLFGIDRPSAMALGVAFFSALLLMIVGIQFFLRVERRLADII
jgi:lipopolysaccharide transport system permease protein